MINEEIIRHKSNNVIEQFCNKKIDLILKEIEYREEWGETSVSMPLKDITENNINKTDIISYITKYFRDAGYIISINPQTIIDCKNEESAEMRLKISW